jgi:hypothetical protein
MTIQDSSFLLSDGPAQLLERRLEDFAAALRLEGDLSYDHLEAIDYALRHTVVRLLVRAAEREELAETYGALRALVPVAREEELAEWAVRWRGYADLLDARLAALAARDEGDPRKLMHAEPILDLVEREEGLAQGEIGERLDLKPANLSRILGVLEAAELIERRSVGREKRVFPGRLAQRRPAEAAPPIEASPDRFVRHLALKKAS